MRFASFRRHALLRRFVSDEGGAAIVLAVLGLPLFVGGLGLGAETGYWYMSQRQLQHGADLASHAAAVRLQAGKPKSELEVAALEVARTGGYASDPQSTFRLNAPPLSGAKAGDAMSVEVILSRAHPPLFSGLFRSGAVNANGRAVSSVLWSGSQACILALNPTKSGALTATGSTSVSLSGCDLAANSNAADAISVGSSNISARCASSVGGVSGTPTLECAQASVNASPARDPYASVVEPVVTGSCESDNVGKNGSVTQIIPVNIHPSGVPFMRFCKGLDVKGDVVLGPGLYIMEADMRILGGSTTSTQDITISGSGVTIYFTSGATIALTGRTTVKLSAPTSGPYSGILFFGTRTGPITTQRITANPSSSLQGAVYLPRGEVKFAGSGDMSGGCIQIIADSVEFTGNSSLSASCTSAGTQSIKSGERVVIVE